MSPRELVFPASEFPGLRAGPPRGLSRPLRPLPTALALAEGPRSVGDNASASRDTSSAKSSWGGGSSTSFCKSVGKPGSTPSGGRGDLGDSPGDVLLHPKSLCSPCMKGSTPVRRASGGRWLCAWGAGRVPRRQPATPHALGVCACPALPAVTTVPSVTPTPTPPAGRPPPQLSAR